MLKLNIYYFLKQHPNFRGAAVVVQNSFEDNVTIIVSIYKFVILFSNIECFTSKEKLPFNVEHLLKVAISFVCCVEYAQSQL